MLQMHDDARHTPAATAASAAAIAAAAAAAAGHAAGAAAAAVGRRYRPPPAIETPRSRPGARLATPASASAAAATAARHPIAPGITQRMRAALTKHDLSRVGEVPAMLFEETVKGIAPDPTPDAHAATVRRRSLVLSGGGGWGEEAVLELAREHFSRDAGTTPAMPRHQSQLVDYEGCLRALEASAQGRRADGTGQGGPPALSAAAALDALATCATPAAGLSSSMVAWSAAGGARDGGRIEHPSLRACATLQTPSAAWVETDLNPSASLAVVRSERGAGAAGSTHAPDAGSVHYPNLDSSHPAHLCCSSVHDQHGGTEPRPKGAAACSPPPPREAWTTLCTERAPVRAACLRDESGCRTTPSALAPHDTHGFGPTAQPATGAADGARGAARAPPYAWAESGADGQSALSPSESAAAHASPAVPHGAAHSAHLAARAPPYEWVEETAATPAGAAAAARRTPRSEVPASRTPPYEWREDAVPSAAERVAAELSPIAAGGRVLAFSALDQAGGSEASACERGCAGCRGCVGGSGGSPCRSSPKDATHGAPGVDHHSVGGVDARLAHARGADGGSVGGVGFAGAPTERLPRHGKRQFGPVYTPPSGSAAGRIKSPASLRSSGCAQSIGNAPVVPVGAFSHAVRPAGGSAARARPSIPPAPAHGSAASILRGRALLPSWGGPGDTPCPPSSHPTASHAPSRRMRVLRLAGGPPRSPAPSCGGGGESSLDAQLGASRGSTPAR